MLPEDGIYYGTPRCPSLGNWLLPATNPGKQPSKARRSPRRELGKNGVGKYENRTVECRQDGPTKITQTNLALERKNSKTLAFGAERSAYPVSPVDQDSLERYMEILRS
jgi:hypothetical protein